jgi:hypothetical protein
MEGWARDRHFWNSKSSRLLSFEAWPEDTSKPGNSSLIAVVDGLKRFPEAITAIFPQALVQTCIVHLVRYILPVLQLEESTESGEGTPRDLPCRERGVGLKRLRRRFGEEVSDDCAELEEALGASDPVFQLQS